uniref:Uncharacterized protein n=1 Tax=Ixodes ricinus TaxID=34613 RepID=A0A147BHQ7_IXORI
MTSVRTCSILLLCHGDGTADKVLVVCLIHKEGQNDVNTQHADDGCSDGTARDGHVEPMAHCPLGHKEGRDGHSHHQHSVEEERLQGTAPRQAVKHGGPQTMAPQRSSRRITCTNSNGIAIHSRSHESRHQGKETPAKQCRRA